jgi:hypothetical protein
MQMRKRRKVKLRKAFETVYQTRETPHGKVLHVAYTIHTARYMCDVFSRMYNADSEDILRFI